MTDSCNLKCPFCYVKQTPANLSAKKAIEFIKDNSPHTVVFHGGEPLLRAADILEIMNAAPEVAHYSITSNLMLPFTKERLEVLKRVNGMATSYSVDRFHSAEQLKHFKTALDTARKYKPVTLLVTLSYAQLAQPAENLCKTLEWLNADNISLERLRDDSIETRDKYEELYKKTDEYLYEIFSKKLIPECKNNLLRQMKSAIEMNSPLFATHCQKMTTTLLADGENTTSCPNGNMEKGKKLRECLACNLGQFCKGDCPSFGRLSCSFPKKTFMFVKGGL